MDINIENLTYHRGEKPVFPAIDFCLEKGDILQVLGSNGSGKTTLLKTLAGIFEPSQGSIQPKDFSKLWIGHETGMNQHLSPMENLFFYQRMHGLNNQQAIRMVLTELNLKQQLNQPLQQLSAGQKQRTALAQLVLIPASVWLLDEPYSHLDQNSINWLNQKILAHSQQQGVVIFTSHQTIDLPKQKYLSL